LTIDREVGLSQNETKREHGFWYMTGHRHEPHITCPKCSHQIPLTESIAAPLLEAERRDFQKKLAKREEEFTRKADDLRQQQDEVAKEREGIEEQVNQRLEAQRKQVIADEARKAHELVARDLTAMKQQLEENAQLLQAREAKLAEAQQAQAEALRKQRELDEKTRELEVTIEKRVQESQAALVTKARQDAADELKAQVSQSASVSGIPSARHRVTPRSSLGKSPASEPGLSLDIWRMASTDATRGCTNIFHLLYREFQAPR
jgi:hypothetical protein